MAHLKASVLVSRRLTVNLSPLARFLQNGSCKRTLLLSRRWLHLCNDGVADQNSRTSTKASRIKEFQDAFNIPELTEEESATIESEGAKLHKRVYMRNVFGE